MNFIEKILKVITYTVYASIVIPLILAFILYFGKDTAGFTWVMLNAASIGVINLIGLHFLKKLLRGTKNEQH